MFSFGLEEQVSKVFVARVFSSRLVSLEVVIVDVAVSVPARLPSLREWSF